MRSITEQKNASIRKWQKERASDEIQRVRNARWQKAVFEYDENGVGKITLECMDELMGMIADRPPIETKQVKYFDEEEKVWKTGEVIVDG